MVHIHNDPPVRELNLNIELPIFLGGLNKLYWGYHLLLNCKNCNDKISVKNQIKEFVKELVDKIDMKAYGEPIIEHFATHDPKKGGYSLVQLIETSSITGHFVDADGSAYIDIFSCKTFDIETVMQVVNKYFNPESISKNFIERSV